MENNLFNSVKDAAKHWWISLLIGLLSIFLGVFSIIYPINALVALTLVFIISFFISGTAQIVYAITNKNTLNSWGWVLAGGIIDILIGILLTAMPGGNILIFIFYIGFAILFQSFIGIGASIELQKAGVKGWGWTLAFSILAVIFSFILILNPAFTAEFITVMAALMFFMIGMFRIMYAIKLKEIGKYIDKFGKK